MYTLARIPSSRVVLPSRAQSNDLIGHLHDILQYHELVAYLKSVVDDDKDGETVLLGTADHECGGLTLVCSLVIPIPIGA